VRDTLHAMDLMGSYNFEYAAITSQNPGPDDGVRGSELNVYWVPTVYIDGGDLVAVGGGKTKAFYNNAFGTAGAREVPDFDFSVSLVFNSDSSLTIDVSATLNSYINARPTKPPMPSGPGTGLLYTEHTYSSTSTDMDGDLLYFRWSWGDGDTSGWLGPYNSGDTCSASHSWTVSNTYQIKCQAKDSIGAESDWSYSKWVYFSGMPNLPPQDASVQTGPQTGYMGVEYAFTGNATDMEQDLIYYQWSWGDGDSSEWLGPYESGQDCEDSHIWSQSGIFEVKLRAKDSLDNVGEWSDPMMMDIAAFICGDGNVDQEVNVSDAVLIINYVFASGNPPTPLESGDVDCSGDVNVSDAVWIINYVFVNGPDPCDC
jgi:hypothetical protein